MHCTRFSPAAAAVHAILHFPLHRFVSFTTLMTELITSRSRLTPPSTVRSSSALTSRSAALFVSFLFTGSDELSGYLFVVGTSWSMAHVLVTRGHVRIDALYGAFSPKVRGWLDLIALLVMAIFIGALIDRAWDVAYTSLIENIRSNTSLRVPLAWPQIPWFLGFALFFLALVLAIIRTFGALLRGDYATVQAVAGAASQDEEIEGELKGLGLQTAVRKEA